MTFVGYDIGSKAYKFMRKDNAVFTAAHALFDENTYPRLKNENGFGKNKLLGSPTGITKDQEDIIIPTNPKIKLTDHGLEDKPEIPDEPEEPPQQLRRSSRVPKPVIHSDNVYGKKPAIEIEKEICNKMGWQKAIEPKTSLITKNFNTLIKEDIESLLKQGGNHMIQFLLAQAEKSPKEMQYRDILVIKG